MDAELRCPACEYTFPVQTDLPADDVLENITGAEGWYALGDGQTFEDLIHANLAARGTFECPECAAAVGVGEEELNEMALALLGRC